MLTKRWHQMSLSLKGFFLLLMWYSRTRLKLTQLKSNAKRQVWVVGWLVFAATTIFKLACTISKTCISFNGPDFLSSEHETWRLGQTQKLEFALFGQVILPTILNLSTVWQESWKCEQVQNPWRWRWKIETFGATFE